MCELDDLIKDMATIKFRHSADAFKAFQKGKMSTDEFLSFLITKTISENDMRAIAMQLAMGCHHLRNFYHELAEEKAP